MTLHLSVAKLHYHLIHQPCVSHMECNMNQSNPEVTLRIFLSLTHTHISHSTLVVRRSTLVLNVSGQPLAHVLPRVFKVTVSTLCVKHGLCAVGGFHGEIVIRSLQHPGLLMADRLTRHENCISNGLDLFLSPTGAIRAACANNDGFVRTLDIESGRRLGQFGFEYPVNYTVAQPDGGKLLAVVGDDPVTHVLDANSGAAVFQLSGHLDFSFAAAWHPSGHVLATGNQDTTARIWDLRHAREALHVLKGRMGAVRSLQYSSNGAFLSMAEPADFAHVFDVGHDYRVAQEIDVFGEIAGCTFSPCGEAYYVAIADAQYGSLMQFERALPADVPPPEGYEGPVVGRYKAVTTVPVAEGSGGGSHVRAPGSHVYFAAGGGPAIPAASVAAEVEAVSPFEHLDDVAAAAVAAAADEGEEEGGAGNAAAAAERARRRLLSTHMSMWPRNAGEGPGLGQLGGAFLVNLRGHLGVQSRAQELEGSGPGSGAVSTVALLVAATTGLEDLTE